MKHLLFQVHVGCILKPTKVKRCLISYHNVFFFITYKFIKCVLYILSIHYTNLQRFWILIWYNISSLKNFTVRIIYVPTFSSLYNILIHVHNVKNYKTVWIKGKWYIMMNKPKYVSYMYTYYQRNWIKNCRIINFWN